MDLRTRVIGSVMRGGLSCHRAAAQFGVAPSTVIDWVSAGAGVSDQMRKF
jgi:putative transposase